MSVCVCVCVCVRLGGSDRFFRSSAVLGLMSLRFSMGFRSIKHSKTMVIEPASGTFGSVSRCRVLLGDELSISIKLVSRRKHAL